MLGQRHSQWPNINLTHNSNITKLNFYPLYIVTYCVSVQGTHNFKSEKRTYIYAIWMKI